MATHDWFLKHFYPAKKFTLIMIHPLFIATSFHDTYTYTLCMCDTNTQLCMLLRICVCML